MAAGRSRRSRRRRATDGRSATAPRRTRKDAGHAYKKPGWYSLALFADDGKGLANSKQESSKVVHVNQPPHAEAGPDQLVCPGDTVAFDGSASRDLDGKIKLYHWDFGDGATLEGDKVEHVFDKPGTYKVTLTVTDDQGSTCSATTDSMDVVVNAPPVADAGKDREVFIGGAERRGAPRRVRLAAIPTAARSATPGRSATAERDRRAGAPHLHHAGQNTGDLDGCRHLRPCLRHRGDHGQHRRAAEGLTANIRS